MNLSAFKLALAPLPDICARLGLEVNGSRMVLCPAHSESTPSCRVYEDHVHCFGCGAHFDGIDLVRHVRGCDFWEALEWIAHEFGLPVPRRDPEAQARYEAQKTISDFYEQIVRVALEHQDKAIAYLTGRGISRDVAVAADAGFLPPEYRVSDRELAACGGLLNKKGGVLFAGRMVIPIRRAGGIVNLYGRVIEPNEHRPTHVYCGATDPPMPAAIWGLDDCPRGSEIWLCESIIDALTLRTHGYQAVACFGTQGLTDKRVQLLKRRNPSRVVICFDVDANGSGQKAALAAGEKLFRAGIEAAIVTLPLPPSQAKEDVNSFFRARTRAEFEKLERREYFELLCSEIPRTGSLYQQKNAVSRVIQVVAARDDELLDSGLLRQVHVAAPDFKLSVLEKQVRELRRDRTDRLPTGSDFRPDAYSDAILQNQHLMHFSGEFYRYESGVYRHVPEPEVRRLIQDLGSGQLKKTHIEDVVHSLSIKTFRRPEQVNRPGTLILRNGWLDLTCDDPELQTHTPDLLSTIQLPIAYNDQAECPQFMQFGERVLPEPALRALLQEQAGYLLVPDSSHQIAFIMHGPTQSGKSTWLHILSSILGEENISSISLERLGERFMTVQLQGRLANITSEISVKEFVADGIIKAVIAGDRIIGEQKNKPTFSFRPYARLVVACNDLPLSHDVSAAFFRRWLPIPFPISIPPEHQNSDLADQIIAHEAEGVLLWALAGLGRLRRNRSFTRSESSQRVISQWRHTLDHALEFRDLFLVPTPGADIPLQTVFKQFHSWCERTNRKTRFTDSNLRQRLEAVGVSFKRRKIGWRMLDYSMQSDIQDSMGEM
ncbi:MAG: phage/plasmid primase, P4 family [Thermodesulfobacteriota bacterium]